MRSNIADALEAVSRAAIGEGDEVRHEIPAHFLRIDEVRHAELSASAFLRGLTSTPMILLAHHVRALDDI